MKEIIVICASSRKNGETAELSETLANKLNCEVLFLKDYTIQQYDYHHENQKDDFLALITRLINDYDCFVFATPVYWYSMSGYLKVFLDRFTDLLTIHKDLGRKLRSKQMAVVTSSIGNHLGETFFLPFQKTADYLGMDYLDGLHCIAGENYATALDEFALGL